MATTINPALKANLERVIDDVRWAAAKRMAWVRLAIAFVATFIFFAVRSNYQTGPSQIASLGYLAISAAVVALSRSRRLVPVTSLSVAFIDVPFITVAQYAQSLVLPERWYIIPANIGLMCLLVTLSTLSLSRVAILATGAMATPSMVWMSLRAGLPWQPVLLVGAIPSCLVAVGFGVVSRIRALVQAARKRDLLGKYVLGERLGVGGMAEVFMATYCPEGGFERRVAIKRMLPDIASDQDSVVLFRREAELGAILAHPNIVQVLDFGADDGSYFMALEYVDGTSLSGLIRATRTAAELLPLPAVVLVALGLAEALDHLHTRTAADGRALGLVHRDVNPPNVLVSRIGEVKLSDLGIARGALNTQLTAVGSIRGKISYSPPEQILGQELDGRVDLFALGVTLHETLTAQRLFKGREAAEIARSAMNDPILPPSALRGDVPPELDALVLGLLERDRAQRTPSAAVLLEALRALPFQLRNPDRGRQFLAERVSKARQEPVPIPSAPEAESSAAASSEDPTRTRVARAPD